MVLVRLHTIFAQTQGKRMHLVASNKIQPQAVGVERCTVVPSTYGLKKSCTVGSPLPHRASSASAKTTTPRDKLCLGFNTYGVHSGRAQQVHMVQHKAHHPHAHAHKSQRMHSHPHGTMVNTIHIRYTTKATPLSLHSTAHSCALIRSSRKTNSG